MTFMDIFTFYCRLHIHDRGKKKKRREKREEERKREGEETERRAFI